MSQENAKFKALIQKKGGNQSEIARKVGVSSQLIGQYIKGRQKPKPEFLVKWKRVFGEDLTDMFQTNVSRETAENELTPQNIFHDSLEGYGSPKLDKTDEYIQFLKEQLKEARQELKESQSKGLLSTLGEIEAKLSGFLVEMKTRVDMMEHLVKTQLMNQSHAGEGEVKSTDNIPIVEQQIYSGKGTAQKKGTPGKR